MLRHRNIPGNGGGEGYRGGQQVIPPRRTNGGESEGSARAAADSKEGLQAGSRGARVFENGHQSCRLADDERSASGAGRFGKTGDGTGLVVMDVEDRIKFSNL